MQEKNALYRKIFDSATFDEKGKFQSGVPKIEYFPALYRYMQGESARLKMDMPSVVVTGAAGREPGIWGGLRRELDISFTIPVGALEQYGDLPARNDKGEITTPTELSVENRASISGELIGRKDRLLHTGAGVGVAAATGWGVNWLLDRLTGGDAGKSGWWKRLVSGIAAFAGAIGYVNWRVRSNEQALTQVPGEGQGQILAAASAAHWEEAARHSERGGLLQGLLKMVSADYDGAIVRRNALAGDEGRQAYAQAEDSRRDYAQNYRQLQEQELQLREWLTKNGVAQPDAVLTGNSASTKAALAERVKKEGVMEVPEVQNYLAVLGQQEHLRGEFHQLVQAA